MSKGQGTRGKEQGIRNKEQGTIDKGKQLEGDNGGAGNMVYYSGAAYTTHMTNTKDNRMQEVQQICVVFF